MNRVLFYALGGGHGHLTRTSHLVKELQARRPECSTLVLCPGRAEPFARQFSSCASTDDIGRAGLSAWVRRQIETFQPDLMVVDTFPRGVLGEFDLPLSLPRVLITRWVDPRYYQHPEVYRGLQQYQHVLWTEPIPMQGLPGQQLSPIMAAEAPLPRQTAREALGAGENPLVLGIGSGSLQVQLQLSSQLRELCQRNGWNLRWHSWEMDCSVQGLGQMLKGADLVVTAAGYNSFYELLRAGVPAVLIPQERKIDDQFRRARGGLGIALQAAHRVNPTDLETALGDLIGSGQVRGVETCGRVQVVDILMKTPVAS